MTVLPVQCSRASVPGTVLTSCTCVTLTLYSPLTQFQVSPRVIGTYVTYLYFTCMCFSYAIVAYIPVLAASPSVKRFQFFFFMTWQCTCTRDLNCNYMHVHPLTGLLYHRIHVIDTQWHPVHCAYATCGATLLLARSSRRRWSLTREKLISVHVHVIVLQRVRRRRRQIKHKNL